MSETKRRSKGHKVLIRNAGMGLECIQGRDVMVVRGLVVEEFFGAVTVPPYQRMAMTIGEKHDDLKRAFAPGGIGSPDDLLFTAEGQPLSQGGGIVLLQTPELIVLDGHQRYSAAMARLAEKQHSLPFGAKIILGLTLAEQMNVFYQVNRLQTPVATQVHLRNSSDTTAIRALLDMAAETPWFPNVQTDQQRKKGEQITLHMLLEVAIMLHGYKTKNTIEEILDALKELTDAIGAESITANVKKFFEALHRCFGTKVGEGKEAFFTYEGDYERVIYRIDFLRGLAILFGNFTAFWDTRWPERLLVRAPEINKLRGISSRSVEDALSRSDATAASYRNFKHRIEVQRDDDFLVRRIAPWHNKKEKADQ
ncbi:MAG TPA: hypothetical protein VLI05_02270 [Candidatus Saccharimonadia bacterium]|nr:hypothetical protein [Candidatus Saccharimonadia bacterium]